MDAKKINRKINLEQWDKAFLWHPFTQHFLWEKDPLVIVESGKGVYLKDIQGRRYLDGVSSLWVNLHGHGHPVLNKALTDQIKRISHSTFLGLSHVPGIQFARDLIRVAPKGLSRVFYSDNGSTAVEVALKMAYQYWVEKEGARGKTEFLAIKGSYHGDTVGAVSVGGIDTFHSKFKPLLFKTNFAMMPHCVRCPFNKMGVRNSTRCGEKTNRIPRPGQSRPETGCRWECLGDVEKILKKKTNRIAAGILEPLMMGAGGMIATPAGYSAGFARLIRKHKALLIADEVATGFCRTGTLFAVEQENVKPDLMCLAKGITGGYAPLSATLTTESVFKAFRAPVIKGKTFFHGHSYTGNPLGASVAIASLKLIKNTNLLEKTRWKAHLLRGELEALHAVPNVGSIRQVGLMVGIELVKNKKTLEPFSPHLRIGARVCKKLLQKGIWMRPLGDVLILMPPPVISDLDLKRMVRSVGWAIRNELPQ